MVNIFTSAAQAIADNLFDLVSGNMECEEDLKVRGIEETVDDPLAFPVPNYNKCVIRRVFISDSNSNADMLESISGNYYELGRTIRRTIYGEVKSAIVLDKCGFNKYNRRLPLHFLAVKIYVMSKLQAVAQNVRQYPPVGNLPENPFAEFSALACFKENPHPNIMNQVKNLFCDYHFIFK